MELKIFHKRNSRIMNSPQHLRMKRKAISEDATRKSKAFSCTWPHKIHTAKGKGSQSPSRLLSYLGRFIRTLNYRRFREAFPNLGYQVQGNRRIGVESHSVVGAVFPKRQIKFFDQRITFARKIRIV